MIEAFKHYFGEYPFDRDGYKLIQAPYTGMEHQSAVTYGNGFKNGYGGRDWTGVGVSPKFDFIIIHESGHEWFGNAVSASDVADMWIQEGWCTYLEAMYVEQVFGKTDALKYINGYKTKVKNTDAILRTRGRHESPKTDDQYFKGALFLHTLRGVMNDDAKWWALIRETYDSFKYKNILTEDISTLFTKRFGKDMVPVFNQYLRHTALPQLELVFDAPDKKVSYRWKADETKFAMPIRVGEKTAWQTITPTTAWQTMDSPLTKDQFDVDAEWFYVTVSKTDKTGDLPAAPAAAAARETTPEQAAYNEAMKLKENADKVAALRKVIADYPTAVFLRQVNGSLFNLLTRMPDRKSEVPAAFNQVVADAEKMTTDKGIRLTLIAGNVAQALENGIVLDNAGTVLTDLLQAAGPDAQAAFRASGLEALGRWYQAKNDSAKAEQYFSDALKVDATSKASTLGLAKLAATAGNDQKALGYYLQAATMGALKGDDEKAFHALYVKVNGSEKNLEKDIDKTFREHFANPVEPAKWTASPLRTTRIVLAELFTGSGCPPCVAADYALDAAMERYGEADLATLVYHVHVPQPDPMTTAASVARKDYYKEYVLGVPTFIVDGELSRLGGGGRDNSGITYGTYANSIDPRMNTAPDATLALKASLKNATVTVQTSVSGLSAKYKDAKDLTVHIALAEQELTFTGENGMRFHPLVVRAMAGGDKPGVALKTDASGKATIDTTFDLATIPTDITSSLDAEIKKRRGNETAGSTPATYKAEGHPYTTVDPKKLIVVAFVQDADKHVLQAVQLPVDAKAWKAGESKK